jgi:hypothetical protein
MHEMCRAATCQKMSAGLWQRLFGYLLPRLLLACVWSPAALRRQSKCTSACVLLLLLRRRRLPTLLMDSLAPCSSGLLT